MMGIATILWSMALAAQAAATPPALPSDLQQLVASSAYQANIARMFAALPPEVFQRCPSLVSKGSQVAMLKPVSFNAAGSPVAGLWKHSFPVSGCGNDTIINFFFVGQPSGKIGTVTAAPGGTHADLTLQRDAVRYVSLAATSAAKGCTVLHVRDTRYEGADPLTRGTRVAPPWHEIWSMAACGAIIDVPVTFIPDATGTTISTQAVRPAR